MATRRAEDGSSSDRPSVDQLTDRERRLVQFVLAQESLRDAIEDGLAVELRATSDERRNSLFPTAATVEVSSGDASEALRVVGELKGGLSVILLHNALQFIIETRQFLGACFSKLAIGGLLIVSVPHQFLYERKLRLPSRRNRLHRRFYTPNTLMADIEEAIDPCECRLRCLADIDADYNYRAGLSSEPEGGQDIVAALEKIAPSLWRSELEQDELWIDREIRPTRYVEVDEEAPAQIRMVAPDNMAINRVIILKLDHRGDFMMATDSFSILRNTFQTAEMTLVCGSWNVAEAKRIGLFDKVIPFDFFPEDDSARLETLPREVLAKKFGEQISGNRYDLAVDLRLYDDTREILRVIEARNRAGFDRYDSFPWLSIRLNTPSATVDDRAETGVITAEHFHTSIGKHRFFEIRADAPHRPENRQSLIWGPYQDLKPGRYEFECLIEPLAEEFELPFDIVTDKASRTINAGILPIKHRQYPRFDFLISEKIQNFEFRIIGAAMFESKPFRFMGVRFVRQAVIRGVHQTEAMSLLAHLVRLRLQNAYATELL
jgi:hypothetical protein